MKRAITFLLALAALVCARAQESLNLGYCDGQLASTSDLSFKGTNQWGEAAIYFPADGLKAYEGNNIVSVRVGLVSRINLDSLVIWIRKDLEGPNVQEHIITKDSSPRISTGWNEMVIETPMPVDGSEGLYIGYSYKQRSGVATISYVDNPQQNAFFVRLGDDAVWEDRCKDGALSIEAVLQGERLPQYDLQLKRATVMWASDGSMTIMATVRNKAAKTVNGFTLTASIDGTDISFDSSFSDVLASGEETEVSFKAQSDIEGIGTIHPVNLSISSLGEGVQDENTFNNTLTADFFYRRHVLLEEFTTEQCLNCPDVADIVNSVLSDDPYSTEVSMVAHHAGYYTDSFTQPCDNSLVWLYNSNGALFAPAMMFDRYASHLSSAGMPTPVVFVSDKSTLESYLTERIMAGSQVYMDVTLATEDSVHYDVHVEGGRSAGFDTDMFMTIYLTESNVPAIYQQGATGGFYHNHLIRTYNSIWGEPIIWNDDNTFSFNWSFEINDGWNPDNLEVVALAAAFDETDPSECAVENCAAARLKAEVATGINTPVSSCVGKTYYDLQGRKLESVSDASGICIVKEVRGDGTVVVRKVVSRR